MDCGAARFALGGAEWTPGPARASGTARGPRTLPDGSGGKAGAALFGGERGLVGGTGTAGFVECFQRYARVQLAAREREQLRLQCVEWVRRCC